MLPSLEDCGWLTKIFQKVYKDQPKTINDAIFHSLVITNFSKNNYFIQDPYKYIFHTTSMVKYKILQEVSKCGEQ